jgi:hypothetical protein
MQDICRLLKVQEDKAIPVQAWRGPEDFRRLIDGPKFQDNRHIKAVRLSALRIGPLYSPGNIPGNHFRWRLSRPQGHSAAGRIKSMKNSSETLGNRTRDLLSCSATAYPTLVKAENTVYKVGVISNSTFFKFDKILNIMSQN